MPSSPSSHPVVNLLHVQVRRVSHKTEKLSRASDGPCKKAISKNTANCGNTKERSIRNLALFPVTHSVSTAMP